MAICVLVLWLCFLLWLQLVDGTPRRPPLPSTASPAQPPRPPTRSRYSALTRHSSSRQGDSVQKAIDALILRHNNSEHSGSCEELAFIDVKLRCPQLQLPLSAP